MDTAVASEDELEVLRGQVDSSAEYWEALIARGYLPQAWADDPRRRFQCWYCRGRPPHYELRDCTVCQNQGYLPAPAVRHEMVHVARQWRKMLEAEALFAEGLAGLQQLGLDAPYAEQPEGESAVMQYYAPVWRRVTLAREDIEPRWIGAWVAVSVTGLAVQHDCAVMDRIGALEALPTLYAEEIAEAKARWAIFRRWCVENLALDPGEGSLLLAYDID